jgi:hypothetical protein
MQFGSRESPFFAHADVYMKIKIKMMESLTRWTSKQVAIRIILLVCNVCARIPGTLLARANLYRVNTA